MAKDITRPRVRKYDDDISDRPYGGETVKPFKLYPDEIVRETHLYEDEAPRRDLSSFGDAAKKIMFRLGDPAAMAERYVEELQKAADSEPGHRTEIIEAYKRGVDRCESPIEFLLFPWLIAQRYQFFDYRPSVLLPGETGQYVKETLSVIPQLPIGRYRADFALAAALNGPIRFVVIECDGAAFHNGVENVKRDVDRDVAILANKRVLDVFRLDGAEIFRSPQKAAQKAAKAVLEAWRKK